MLELGPTCSVSQVMHRRSSRSPPLLRVGSWIGLDTVCQAARQKTRNINPICAFEGRRVKFYEFMKNTKKSFMGTNPVNYLNVIPVYFFKHNMYPEKPEGTQVIIGSINMGYISVTAKNRTQNMFRPKCGPIPLGHSDRY